MTELNSLKFQDFLKNIERINSSMGKLDTSLQNYKNTVDDSPDDRIYISADRKSYYKRDNTPQPENTYGNNENWLSFQLLKKMGDVGKIIEIGDYLITIHDILSKNKLVKDPYQLFANQPTEKFLWETGKLSANLLPKPYDIISSVILDVIEYQMREDNRIMQELNKRHYFQPIDQQPQITGDVLGNTADPNAWLDKWLNKHIADTDTQRILDDFNKPYLGKTREELKQIDANFTKTLKNIFQPKNNGEAPAALGPSAKNQKQKVRRVKVRKPPKPKTTADENYGDDFLNQVYNSTKSALELNNLKFDKSKLLVESINFENAYLQAFNKEIDYKKEIGILQDELSKLEGDDLETKKKKLTLQTEINALQNDELNNFLVTGADKLESLKLNKGSEKEQRDVIKNIIDGINERLKDETLTVPKRTALEKTKKYYEAEDSGFIAKKGVNPIEEQNKKPKASQKPQDKKKEDPVETFTAVFGEAQKVGGALTTIMQTLNIGADTFVGGIISGFNSALAIIQSILAVMEAMKTINSIIGFIPGLATGGTVPGIGDTDSVPAMLTPGEYVVKKSVVNKFGTGFFEWINGGGLTNSLAGHYAGGGMVAASGRQMVAVSIPDVKIKGSDLYLSWRRENNTQKRRSI